MHRVTSVLHALRRPLALALCAGVVGALSAAAAADHKPAPSVPPVAITTAVLPAAQQGSAYQATLTSTGGSGTTTWKVSAGSLPAGLSLSAAGVLSGTPTATGTAHFTVEATAAGPIFTSPPGPPFQGFLPFPQLDGFFNYVLQQLGLAPAQPGPPPRVIALNDAVTDLALTVQPAVVVNTTVLPAAQVNIPYFVSLTAQGGSASGAFVWRLAPGSALPAGLTLSPTGLLEGTPTTVGLTTFSVEAADVSTPAYVSSPQALSLKVVPPGLQITTYELPNGTVGEGYSQLLTAIGGTPHIASNGASIYQWSLVPGSGVLPAGLSLDTATGEITGTPASSGTQGFTVQVTDFGSADGSIPPASTTEPLTITINPSVGITIDTSSVPTTATQGTTYSGQVSVTGGTAPYTFSLSGEPDNLSINSAGDITGTPSQAGDFNMQITVTDTNGLTASTQVLLTVAQAAPLSITTTSLPDGTVQTAYQATLSASPSSSSNIWTTACSVNQSAATSDIGTCVTDAAGNALPQGLSLDPSTGAITGTPTAPGSYSLAVVVSDSGAAQTTCATNATNCASTTLNLTIHGTQLVITTTSPLPDAAVGEPYSDTLAGSGGVAPYTWKGLLCTTSQTPCYTSTGLRVGPNGLITGTPAAGTEGTYTFTVEFSDAAGDIVSTNLTITIEPPLTITTAPTLPEASGGTAYSQTLTASGGVSPYTWSLSCTAGSGNTCLPSGLSLDASTGAITGTPTQGTGGESSFTATVTDKSGATAAEAMSIDTLSVSTASLPNATENSTYSAQLAAVGGSGSYSWSCSTGLPSGLSCSPTGAISGKPTVSGTFTITATVTDSNNVSSTRQVSLTVAS